MNAQTQDANTAMPTKLHNDRMLTSLHQLLNELVPLVDRIRHNLKESTTHMPDVSKQLSSVSQATEMATVEILNVLEEMTTTITNSQLMLSDAKKKDEARAGLLPRISELIEQSSDDSLRELWSQYVAQESNAPRIEQLEQALAKTSEQTMSIAMSLQVQDITAQQIAGATHLIEQVEDHLQTALRHFDAPDNSANGVSLHGLATEKPHLTFNSQAEYTKSTLRQDEADRITEEFFGRQA